jgi:hypothetical protein
MFAIKKWLIPAGFLLAGGAGVFGLQRCGKDGSNPLQAKADQPAASSSASAQVPATPQAPIMVTGEKQAPKMDQATWLTGICKVSVASEGEKGYSKRFLTFNDNGTVKVVDLCSSKGIEETEYKILTCGGFNDVYIETTGRFPGKKGYYRIGDPFNAANEKDGRLVYPDGEDVLPLAETGITKLSYWGKDGSRHDVPKGYKQARAMLLDPAQMVCGDGPVMAVNPSKPSGGGKKASAEPGPAYVTLAVYEKDKETQVARDKGQDDEIGKRVTVAELADFQRVCGGKQVADCNYALFHGPRAKGN